ncbi:MAG: hypothetical protein E7016_06530 [Alphaproteobacteria bacterium]|nr:hypothetical protein [Alphaproteobacteria bacterium]
MRKYFLATAVALLTATSVNAEVTDYANIEVKATIDRAKTYDCYPLNFGTIVLNDGATGVVEFDADEITESMENVASWQNYDAAFCVDGTDENGDDNYVDFTDWNIPSTTTIYRNGSWEEDSMSVTITRGIFYISGKLEIPAHAGAGDYTGSFLITKVSE